jgi:hypothetical protein
MRCVIYEWESTSWRRSDVDSLNRSTREAILLTKRLSSFSNSQSGAQWPLPTRWDQTFELVAELALTCVIFFQRKASSLAKDGSTSKKRAKKTRSDTKTTPKRRRKNASKKQQESDEEDSEMSDVIEEDDDDKVASDADSEINDADEEREISEDEDVESSGDEEAAGRGARVKEKRRKEILARNESRAQRRQQRGLE